jgi:hypothetical protein
MNREYADEMAKRGARYLDPDDVVMVLKTRNQVYVDMVIGALEHEGIPALLKSASGYHARGMLPFEQGMFDYLLYVTKVSEARAREIVETIVPSEAKG